MNRELWSQLTNNSKYGNGINVKDLPVGEEKLKECKKIIAYTKNLIKTQFDRSVSFCYMSRTITGYTIHLQCSMSSSGCSSNWSCKINITSNQVSITCNKPCLHLLSTAPSNLLFSILISLSKPKRLLFIF